MTVLLRSAFACTVWLLLSMLLMTPFKPAHAETLRCNGVSAAEGDSRLSVLYKCGQPQLADAYCAPVYYSGSAGYPGYALNLYPVPPVTASAYVPCQPVEEWLYDRGPGNLMATVRFRDGKVQSIRYGKQPR